MPQHEEEEDESIGVPEPEAGSRRTQLGDLRDEVSRLEKTVNNVNSRVRVIVDGPVSEATKSATETQRLDPAPIPNIISRIKAARIRLENGALERLRRIGSD